MFKYFREGSKIKKIASRLPVTLVEMYDEKEFYSRAEVVSVYADKIGLDEDIQIAFAIFCSPSEFKSRIQLLSATLTQLGSIQQFIKDNCWLSEPEALPRT